MQPKPCGDRRAIAEIEEGLSAYSKKDRKRAGVIVTIGDGGEFCLHQGLVDRSTTPAAHTAAADTGGFTDDEDDFDPDLSSGDEAEDFGTRSAASRRCARSSASARASSMI